MRLAEDNSNAPILDYNIPQKSCLPLYSGQIINVPIKYFKKEYLTPIADVYWENIKDKSVINIRKIVVEELQTSTSNFIDNYSLIQQSVLPVVIYDSLSHNERTVYQSTKGELANIVAIKGNTKEVKYQAELQNIREAVSVIDSSSDTKAKKVMQVEQMVKKEVQIVKIPFNLAIEIDLNTMVEQFAKGYKAIAVRQATGKIYLEYFPRLKPKCSPRFYIKYELMQCSYLGNYGAGDTVSTFSLLPGEKTTIAINTYKHSAYSRSRSENILDSISESSVNSFEQAIENQDGYSQDNTEQNTTVNPGKVTTKSTGLIVDLIKHKDTTDEEPTTSNTSINHISTITSKVESAVAQTVNESNHFREVNVNTTSVDLKKSLMFHLSLGSKELFHSNFLAYLFEIYPTETKSFWGLNPNLDLSIHRELHNLDIVISNSETVIVIENKLKSIPTSSQLKKYNTSICEKRKDEKNKVFYNKKVEQYLLTLNGTTLKHADWENITYTNVIEGFLSKIIAKEAENSLQSLVIQDYISFLTNFIALSAEFSQYFNRNNTQYLDYQKFIKDRELSILRIDDFFMKRWGELFLQEFIIKNQEVDNMFRFEGKEGQQECTADIPHWSASTIQNTALCIHLTINKFMWEGIDIYPTIQIQGNQLRLMFDAEIDKFIIDRKKKHSEITDKGTKLIEHFKNLIFKNITNNKIDICQYKNQKSDCIYVYQTIPEDVTINELMEKIIHFGKILSTQPL